MIINNMLIIKQLVISKVRNEKEIKSILKERSERDKALNIENHD